MGHHINYATTVYYRVLHLVRVMRSMVRVPQEEVRTSESESESAVCLQLVIHYMCECCAMDHGRSPYGLT